MQYSIQSSPTLQGLVTISCSGRICLSSSCCRSSSKFIQRGDNNCKLTTECEYSPFVFLHSFFSLYTIYGNIFDSSLPWSRLMQASALVYEPFNSCLIHSCFTSRRNKHAVTAVVLYNFIRPFLFFFSKCIIIIQHTYVEIYEGFHGRRQHY